MSIDRVHCPECDYEFVYVRTGKRGSYRTGTEFVLTCSHANAAKSGDAMGCPVLRSHVEIALGLKFPAPPGGTA